MLAFSDIRLLPPSYQGASISSNEIDGLTLQGGHLNSASLRNEAGDEKMQASSDGFNFAGADYAFNDKRSSLSAWFGQLEDIYNQRFLGHRWATRCRPTSSPTPMNAPGKRVKTTTSRPSACPA